MNTPAVCLQFSAPLCGLLSAGIGISMFVLAVALRAVLLVADPHGRFLPVVYWMIWYGGMPVVVGIVLVLLDLVVFERANRL
jgi:hypothetical protein